MPDTTNNALTQFVERARKVLQHEQRTNHQDQAIKPGGLELFVVRWADQASNACKEAGLDPRPIHSFTEFLEGYRRQDPMQRAASLRAALAILNELDGNTPPAQQPRTLPLSKPLTVAHHNGSATETGPVVARSNNESIRTTPPANPEKKTSAEPAAKPAYNTVRLEAGMTAGHTVLTLLSADITAVPGVGATAAARLHNLGIRAVRDLLFYFPREHRDYSKLVKIASIPFNELTTTMGLIWEVKNIPTSGGRMRTIATISDETGKLNVSWFNQSYLLKQLKAAQGSYLVVTGVKQRFGNKIEFSVRSHELPEQGDLVNTGRLVPTYPLTEGLHAKALRRFTKWVVDRYAAMVPDYLPAAIRSAGKLMPLPDAISHIHYPENETALLNAHRRLGFDELFLIQLGMQERRSRWQREGPRGNAFKIDLASILIDPDANSQSPGPPLNVGAGLAPALPDAPALENPAPLARLADARTSANDEHAPPMASTLWSALATDRPFEATLPFRFTGAQQRVIGEIFADLAQAKPMSRLLQGDVGSVKTAVAAAPLL